MLKSRGGTLGNSAVKKHMCTNLGKKYNQIKYCTAVERNLSSGVHAYCGFYGKKIVRC